jgi:phosphate transport system substrate-binding protein
MPRLRTRMIAAFGLAAMLVYSQDRSALEVQKARNEHVQSRRDLAYHHNFDLSDLPHYKPEQQVSGVIRMVGSNYVADGHIGEYWEKGFLKYHPDIKFQYNLKTPSAAVHALYLGVSDLGPCRKMTFEDLLAYERMMNTDPVEIVYATGSYDVPGWSPAFGIFVNKANPLARLTMKQLEGIFGSERTGAWEGTTWHPERARTPKENIRTWGQVGLTGEWKDKPIHPYGVNLRYHQSTRFEDQVLSGSGKWNSDLREYANFAKPDGTLSIGANQMMEDLANDPYGICYSEITFLNKGVKPLALAAKDRGPYVELTMDNVRGRVYPLHDEVYMYTNHLPGKPMDPKVKEYLRYILSQEGQAEIVHDGKYLPLTAEVVQQMLKRLE